MSTVHYLRDDPAAKRLRAARLEVYRLRIAQAAEQLRRHWPTATAIEMDTRLYDPEDPATCAHLFGIRLGTRWRPVQTEDIPLPLVQIIENTNTYIADALSTGVHSSWREAVHSIWLDVWDRDMDPDNETDHADSKPDDEVELMEGDYLVKLTLPAAPR